MLDIPAKTDVRRDIQRKRQEHDKDALHPHSSIVMEGYAAVLHPPYVRLLPKGIPPLLGEILHASVSAQHLQPVCPMVAAPRREDEPVI